MGNVSHAANLVEAGAVNVNGTGDCSRQKVLDGTQTEKEVGIAEKIKRGLQILGGFLLFFLAILAMNENINRWDMPEPVKSWLLQLCNVELWLSIIIVLFIFTVLHYGRLALAYRHRICGAANLTEEEFDGRPELLVSRIVELCSGQCIKPEKSEKECIGRNGGEMDSCQYAYQKSLRGMEVASVSGEKVDYFLLRYGAYIPEFSVFLIGKNYTKNEAATILTKQGFFFSEEKDHIIHFYRDDLHVRIGSFLWGFDLIGLEVCRGDVPSRMPGIIAEIMKETRERTDSIDGMMRRMEEKIDGFWKGEQSGSGIADKQASEPKAEAETEEAAVSEEKTAPEFAE